MPPAMHQKYTTIEDAERLDESRCARDRKVQKWLFLSALLFNAFCIALHLITE